MHRRAPVQVEAGVVAPDRLAGRRIDRRHLTEVGGGVEHAVDHQGRHLVGVGAEPLPVADDRVLGPQLLVDRRPGPRDAEPVDVVRGDPVERRVLRMARVAAVEAPLVRVGAGLGGRLRGRERRGGQEQASGEETHHRPCTRPSHDPHLGCIAHRPHSKRTALLRRRAARHGGSASASAGNRSDGSVARWARGGAALPVLMTVDRQLQPAMNFTLRGLRDDGSRVRHIRVTRLPRVRERLASSGRES